MSKIELEKSKGSHSCKQRAIIEEQHCDCCYTLKIRDVQHLELCFGPAWRKKKVRRAYIYIHSPVLRLRPRVDIITTSHHDEISTVLEVYDTVYSITESEGILYSNQS